MSIADSTPLSHSSKSKAVPPETFKVWKIRRGDAGLAFFIWGHYGAGGSTIALKVRLEAVECPLRKKVRPAAGPLRIF
jgi:hypothetical protein